MVFGQHNGSKRGGMQQILSEALGAVDIGCILQVPEGWQALQMVSDQRHVVDSTSWLPLVSKSTIA